MKSHTDRSDNFNNCVICGAPLKYDQNSSLRRCSVCGRTLLSNAACEKGHFVCDNCHSYGTLAVIMPQIIASADKDPVKLLEKVMKNPEIHMHGPEHHVLVALVLLTAYRNCGGKIDYDKAVQEVYKRARQVPGGTCGYWGVCGAAAGAGIYASVITGSNPLNKDMWHKPIDLSGKCLRDIASYGGPRCCKRTARLAVENGVRFTNEVFNVHMSAGRVQCEYVRKNKECIGAKCPYFPKPSKELKGKCNLKLKVKA